MNLSWFLTPFLLIFVIASETFDENAKDAFYKWFEMTRNSFDKDELASRYKKLARKYHPDKNKEESAKDIFYKISKAFDVLNDDDKRQRYNVGGIKATEDGPGGGGSYDHSRFAEEIFKKMFGGGFFDMDDIFGGGGGGRRAKGQSVQTEMEVSLEDMFIGKTIQMEYTRTKLCKKCDGTGADSPGDVHECSKCKGRGAYVTVRQVAPGFVQQMQVPCDECSGQGRKIKKKCKSCDGKRVATSAESLAVEIEPGMNDNNVFRFEEKADEHPERDAGDLLVVIKTKEHPVYQRDGVHLYLTIDLSLKQALLGFKISISELDGKTLEISRKDVTQSGYVERIIGHGMPKLNQGGSKKRGDLFVKYNVVLPTKVSSDQRLLLEKTFMGTSNIHDEL